MAVCHRCRTDNPSTSTFCSACGSSLASPSTTQPPPPAAPPAAPSPSLGGLPLPPHATQRTPPPPPPSQGPPSQPPMQPTVWLPRPSTRLSGLATALMVLLIASIPIVALGAVFSFVAASEIAGLADRDLSTLRQLNEAERNQGLAFAAVMLFSIIAMPIFILLVVFAAKARRNLEAWGITGARQPVGMAVGAWFIPIFWYIGPYWTLSDSYRGAVPGAATNPDWRSGSRNGPLLGWWMLWSIANILYWVSLLIVGAVIGSTNDSALLEVIENTNTHANAWTVQGIALVTCIPAAVLGIVGLRRLAKQHDRLTGGGTPTHQHAGPIS
jgi:hypothetical protein